MINVKESVVKQLERTALGQRILKSPRYRIVLAASLSLAVNLAYALYNGVIGVLAPSLWFVTLCAYYVILSVMRFSAVMHERKRDARPADAEWFVMRFSGVLLMLLSVVLAGSVYLSLVRDTAVRYHEIVMITIAAYTFTKVILAIVNVVKVRKSASPLLATIRNISCADAAASILALQRSMLVSFGEMSGAEIRQMNAITGGGVCLLVFLMGVGMALKKRRNG